MIVLVDATTTTNGVGICEFESEGTSYIGVYLTCGCLIPQCLTRMEDRARYIFCKRHGNEHLLGSQYSGGWILQFVADKSDRITVMDRIDEWVADMLGIKQHQVEVVWNGR